VGTSNRVMTASLAQLLKVFTDTLPKSSGITVFLKESNREDLPKQLRDGEIDVAIFGALDDGAHNGFRRKLISSHKMVLIAPRLGFGPYNQKLFDSGELVRMADLDNVHLCLIDADRDTILGHLPEPRPQSNRFVVDNYSSVVSVVKSGAAAGLVVDMGLDDHDLLKFPIDPKDDIRDWQVAIWTLQNQTPSPLAQEFIKVVLGRP
jgi:DNA-binding transcriptional LysR family regulator